jgi:hypothetical protein
MVSSRLYGSIIFASAGKKHEKTRQSINLFLEITKYQTMQKYGLDAGEFY